MRSLKAWTDPAQSRLAYRAQRIAWSRGFRAFLRLGLPLAAMGGVALWVWTDEGRRTLLSDMVYEAKRAIQARPEFAVQMLAIDGASPRLAEEVRAALLLDLPTSSFDLDLAELRARAEALRPVARAQMQVRQAGILHVQVTERRPVALWRRDDGALWSVDGTGALIRPVAQRADRTDLPFVSGRGADVAIAEIAPLVAAAGPLSPRILGFKRRGERRWDMVLDRGQVILLPASLPEETPGVRAIAALEHLLARDAAQDLFARDITVFDMRLADRPTLRLSEAAARELRRIRALEAGVTIP